MIPYRSYSFRNFRPNQTNFTIPSPPTIIITKPPKDDLAETQLTEFSRRIICENLFESKRNILPTKVPKIFRQVIFEKVKLKRENVPKENREKKIPDLTDEENGFQDLDEKQNVQGLPITISRYKIT